MKQSVKIDIDPTRHEEIALLRQALDDQGYTATDENIFIAWTVYSLDYHRSEWLAITADMGPKHLTARLMNYMKPVTTE